MNIAMSKVERSWVWGHEAVSEAQKGYERGQEAKCFEVWRPIWHDNVQGLNWCNEQRRLKIKFWRNGDEDWISIEDRILTWRLEIELWCDGDVDWIDVMGAHKADVTDDDMADVLGLTWWDP